MRAFRQRSALLVSLLFLPSCGQKTHSSEPPPAAPRSAPARDIIVRTDRFALHVNAYVAYYARVSPPSESMDPTLVERLAACSDDASAKTALAGSPYATGLGAYLVDTWTSDAEEAQRDLTRVVGPVLALEELLAPALASQMGRTWPNEAIDVFFARAPRVDPSGRDGPLIDTQGECFGSSALLECVFTRAVETLLPESELGKGIAEARAAQGEAARQKSEAALPCAAALAVDAAVTAADGHFKPTPRFAEACPPSLRVWLGDAWGRRMKGETEARKFGTELVEAMAR
jgi:hypothetical protein